MRAHFPEQRLVIEPIAKGPVIIYVRGARRGKKKGGVKAISDWLEGGGVKLFYKEV